MNGARGHGVVASHGNGLLDGRGDDDLPESAPAIAMQQAMSEFEPRLRAWIDFAANQLLNVSWQARDAMRSDAAQARANQERCRSPRRPVGNAATVQNLDRPILQRGCRNVHVLRSHREGSTVPLHSPNPMRLNPSR